MWRDVLCAIGLGFCEPAQADVSAHTILNLLRQTAGEPEHTAAAMGAFYEDVQVLKEGLQLSLIRAGVQKATLDCKTISGPLELETTLNPKFLTALHAPFPPDTTARLFCTFDYTDGIEEMRAFVTGAEIWAEHALGPLIDDAGPRNEAARLSMHPTSGEVVSVFTTDDSAVLLWIYDLKAQ